MSNLAKFKEFVKQNPSLIKYIRSEEMTWQKFYEMYDMYGDKQEVWKDYIEPVDTATTSATTFDFLNWIKSIDVDSLQENINSVKRVISVFQDLGSNDKLKEEYKPRPIYKHFED